MDFNKAIQGGLVAAMIALAGWATTVNSSIATLSEKVRVAEEGQRALILGQQAMNDKVVELIHKMDKRLTVVEIMMEGGKDASKP